VIHSIANSNGVATATTVVVVVVLVVVVGVAVDVVVLVVGGSADATSVVTAAALAAVVGEASPPSSPPPQAATMIATAMLATEERRADRLFGNRVDSCQERGISDPSFEISLDDENTRTVRTTVSCVEPPKTGAQITDPRERYRVPNAVLDPAIPDASAASPVCADIKSAEAPMCAAQRGGCHL
jgi:hypothetical protein